MKSMDTPPEGYRLLEAGEQMRKTDLFWSVAARDWRPVVGSTLGKWNGRDFWPMARKIKGHEREE